MLNHSSPLICENFNYVTDSVNDYCLSSISVDLIVCYCYCLLLTHDAMRVYNYYWVRSYFLDSYIIQLYTLAMFVLSHTLHNVYIQSRSITFYLCLSV